MANLDLDPTKTALLCMDMHNAIVGHSPMAQPRDLVGIVKRALDGARGAGIQVIYVVVGRRLDFLSPRNKFTAGTSRIVGAGLEAAERMKIVEALTPLEEEPIVRKPRINPFYGTELDSLLRAREIDTLLMTGVATNFVVEAAARYAVDADYRVIVLEDCCAAFSEEEHTCSIAQIDRLAHVATSADFLESIKHMSGTKPANVTR